MEEQIIVAKTGNEIYAEAMRQINPDVVAAYPITPATEIVQIFSQFVADGEVDTEYVPVESEHSAMSACMGASAAGGRAMTATSSQGLALMHEVLHIAAGLRLPIVLAVVSRSLSSPINIHGDFSDIMVERDSGWIQIISENTQEAYDNLIQAVRIAEGAKLPTIVSMEGFIISHCMETAKILKDETVRKFVGEYRPSRYLLDIKNPFTLGALDLMDYYFEHRRQVIDAMEKAKDIIISVANEFYKISGRKYGFFETYKLEDAEIGIVCLGSLFGTAKSVVDEFRKEGKKVGLLKLRVFRPFPAKELTEALKQLKLVVVMERHHGYNAFLGPLANEVRSALYSIGNKPAVINYTYGLGGRDINTEMIAEIFNKSIEMLKTGKIEEDKVNYIGLRE